MSIEEAALAGVRLTLSATLIILGVSAFRRRLNRSFLILALGFAFFAAEGLMLALLTVGIPR